MAQFIDTATIEVKGGDGGGGCLSFRREAHVPKGGPDGGDGGRGGDVIVQADQRESTLLQYRYKRHYHAQRGMHGQGSKRHGKDGSDLILKVPPGTIVRELDPKTQEVLYEIADLACDGQRVVVGPGGHGGKGNIHFVTSTRRAPAFAELGEPAFSHTIGLEMKLLADAALVGLPSVGKSSLIARMSAAHPKIAEYAFTTLVPNLGVVKSDDDSFVIADIPGLIEGASLGKGLGHDFLRHIERSAVIVHVVDATGGLEGRDIVNDYDTINQELTLYAAELANRPRIVVINKIDAEDTKENRARLRKRVQDDGLDVIEVSALTGEGLQTLIRRINDVVGQERIKKANAEDAHDEFDAVWKTNARGRERTLTITKVNPGRWQISSPQLERMVLQTDFENEEALDYLQSRFDRMKLDEQLESAGVQPGDEVQILEHTFTHIAPQASDDTLIVADGEDLSHAEDDA